MADIMQDKYILGQSENKSIQNVGEEIRLDLDLTLNDRDATGTIVEGVVIDNTGNPIEGALVKLMSVEYDPLMHSLTNANGEYIINDLPPDKMYRIYAIAKGKKIKKGTVFVARPYQKVKINFTLENDPAMELGIIAGDVKDLTSNNNLNGAVISLLKITEDNREELKSVVYTNEFGQFVFREVAIGNYIVRSTALGYNVNDVEISIGASGQIASTNIFLTASANKSNGTVSGVIKDTNGQPVDGADVILYNVNADSSLTPIAFTKTDATGVYLFNNVPKGTYKIKSTESKIVKVADQKSPNFDSFTIATVGTLIPLEFTATEGSLFNGARLMINNNFVGYIGGENNGYVVISTIVPFQGIYNLNVEYLAGGQDKILKIKVNDVYIGNDLNCPQTNGWTENDAKWSNVDINLDQGINFIEFYGNTAEFAAFVGKYTVKFKPQSVQKNAATGTLENGAKLIFNNTFVDFIGGENNGSVTVTINTPNYGSNILYIQYLAGGADRPLKIDLNGKLLGDYNVPATNGWEIADAKIYAVPLDLEPGDNVFKFYNINGGYCPVIGNLTLSQPNVNKVYQAENALLFNGAVAENGLVTGIAKDKGYLIFNADIPMKDSYDFIIKYASIDDTVCNIEVNDVDTEETYVFPPTETNNNPTGSISTKLYLDYGKNAIKVYNE